LSDLYPAKILDLSVKPFFPDGNNCVLSQRQNNDKVLKSFCKQYNSHIGNVKFKFINITYKQEVKRMPPRLASFFISTTLILQRQIKLYVSAQSDPYNYQL